MTTHGGIPGCEAGMRKLGCTVDEEIIDEEVTENDGTDFNVARGAWPSDAALTQSLDEIEAFYDAKFGQSAMRRSLKLMASSLSLVELRPLGQIG